MSNPPPLTVLQVLPALNAGGVERGTVEFAKELVARGHRSVVVSNGGIMVPQLQNDGTRHIQMPVHRKSPASFAQVRPMRHLLRELKPDIVHVRSRIPAWITWLAWRKLSPTNRPGLVSTFHGMYSVTPYSAIMTKAQRIIAISDCVHDYILDNYSVDPDIITRIYRGLDEQAFNNSDPKADSARLLEEFPQFKNKHLILMPGRLSRWKGQEAFLDVMEQLVKQEPNCHGVIIGAAEANKEHYLEELLQRQAAKGLQNHITFTGHRSDIQRFYRLAKVTCHLSNKPEPFGRTVPEALACGCPVVAYNRGGASESLNQCFPEGLVEPDNILEFTNGVLKLLHEKPKIELPQAFFLSTQTEATLQVYRALLQENAHQR